MRTPNTEVRQVPGQHGLSPRETQIILTPADGSPAYSPLVIDWQDGPIKEHGVTGIQAEDVIEVLIDRLRMFQASPYASYENGRAIDHLEEALTSLNQRTRAREARGVEGTSAP